MHFPEAFLKKIQILAITALISGISLPFPVQAFEQARSIKPDNVLQAASPSPFRLQASSHARPGAAQTEMTRRSSTALARRWAMASARLKTEGKWLTSCERGACRDPRAGIWHKAVSLVRTSPEHSRHALVQQLIFQSIRYARDPANDDHWATPLSTLLRKAGDCEDHVLLKRAILEAAGSKPSNSRLLILETSNGEGHMVLQILGESPVILDNRFRYPIDAKRLGQDRIAAIATDEGYFVANEVSRQNQSDL